MPLRAAASTQCDVVDAVTGELTYGALDFTDPRWIFLTKPFAERLTFEDPSQCYQGLLDWRDAVVRRAPHLAAIVDAIADRCRQTGWCWAGNRWLAKQTGWSKRTVCRHLVKLEKMGVIVRERAGRRLRWIWPATSGSP
jgi:hypothetical protein